MRSARLLTLAGVLVVSVLGLSTQSRAAGPGPTTTVVHWDFGLQCISGLVGSDVLETVTKDTLPNEWFGSDPLEALKAGAATRSEN